MRKLENNSDISDRSIGKQNLGGKRVYTLLEVAFFISFYEISYVKASLYVSNI